MARTFREGGKRVIRSCRLLLADAVLLCSLFSQGRIAARIRSILSDQPTEPPERHPMFDPTLTDDLARAIAASHTRALIADLRASPGGADLVLADAIEHLANRETK
jgi:hypothetical protein